MSPSYPRLPVYAVLSLPDRLVQTTTLVPLELSFNTYNYTQAVTSQGRFNNHTVYILVTEPVSWEAHGLGRSWLLLDNRRGTDLRVTVHTYGDFIVLPHLGDQISAL